MPQIGRAEGKVLAGGRYIEGAGGGTHPLLFEGTPPDGALRGAPVGAKVVDVTTGTEYTNGGTAASPVWAAAGGGTTPLLAGPWTEPDLVLWRVEPASAAGRWTVAAGALTAAAGDTAYLFSDDFLPPASGIVALAGTVTIPAIDPATATLVGLCGFGGPGGGDTWVNLEWQSWNEGWVLTLYDRTTNEIGWNNIPFPTATLVGTHDFALVYDDAGARATATVYVDGAVVATATENVDDTSGIVIATAYLKVSDRTIVYGPLTLTNGYQGG